MNHFSTGLWHTTKSGFFMTTSDDQLSGWTKKMLQSTSQSQTCTQKRSWSLFGGLLPIWSTTAFWIPVKPVHLKSMLSRFMRCTKNCNACSWLAVVDRKGPKFLKNLLQKLNKLGLICHIQLTSHQPPLLQASWQLFAGKIVSTISRRQKMLSKSWLNPQAWIFHYYLFIYLFFWLLGLHWCVGFSLVAESRGYFLVAMRGLLIVVASHRGAQALGCTGFSSWVTWAQWLQFLGSRAQAQ